METTGTTLTEMLEELILLVSAFNELYTFSPAVNRCIMKRNVLEQHNINFEVGYYKHFYFKPQPALFGFYVKIDVGR